MSDAGDEEASRYVVVLVDGSGRRPMLRLDAEEVDDYHDAAAWFADLARQLREKRVVGRLELIDRETGAVLVRRRVWP